jgi:protein-tyrosine phosphatase
VQDHNPASLTILDAFCRDVDDFLKQDPANVVAVHCRGGKGRTGMCICAWLLYSRMFTSAQLALDFFASRRTDQSLSLQSQGVETPSQCELQPTLFPH